MFCPKCNYSQKNTNLECVKCGVIFSKIYKNELINKSNKINTVRKLHNSLLKSNNEEERYKTIYKCFKNNLADLAIANLKNKKEKKYFTLLLKNKLKTNFSNLSFNSSLFITFIILILILILNLILN